MDMADEIFTGESRNDKDDEGDEVLHKKTKEFSFLCTRISW